MSGPSPDLGATAHANRVPTRSHAVVMLQVFALALMVIPSDTVIAPIGAVGYPAALVGMLMFGVLVAASLFGLHDRREQSNPIRTVLCVLWLAILGSYVLMDRSAFTATETASADRLLLQLAVITGVALMAAEHLSSISDIRRVLRALCWGGAFCGVVAAMQFWISLDVAPYLRELPGFSLNFDNPGILLREGLNRVSGTSVYPIELGVVAGMLLPLAIYLAIYDTDRTAWRRWAPVGLIALAIPASVSRSAIVSVALGLGVLVVLMPVRQRLAAICALPFGLAAVFMSAHGLFGTLASLFAVSGSNDPAVADRVSDYPLVEQYVQEAPWFGRGGWTYIPDNGLDILDNQFLKTTVELGVVGVIALAVFFLVPTIAALVARRRSGDPESRLLCAALAGAALAAAGCSFTFDSLSYPMFVGVHALVIGLIGAQWRLAHGGAPASVPVREESARPISSTHAIPQTGG